LAVHQRAGHLSELAVDQVSTYELIINFARQTSWASKDVPLRADEVMR